MAVNYYVALPFIGTEDGAAPGKSQECQSEGTAIRAGRRNVTGSCQCGAVAFKRAGDPNM
jgi:hypothetical protein